MKSPSLSRPLHTPGSRLGSREELKGLMAYLQTQLGGQVEPFDSTERPSAVLSGGKFQTHPQMEESILGFYRPRGFEFMGRYGAEYYFVKGEGGRHLQVEIFPNGGDEDTRVTFFLTEYHPELAPAA